MWASCSDVVYAKQNGGKFAWTIEGNEAVPIEQSFWDYLMAYGKARGQAMQPERRARRRLLS